MSSSEEDIQATAAFANLRLKSLETDHSHLFRERTVLEIKGDYSSLETIAYGRVPQPGKPGQFLSLLNESGHLDADIYLVPHEDGALVDVHRDLEASVVERLQELAGVTEIDPTAGERWRIFGETPSQKPPETLFATYRFGDSRRREVGARVLRDAAEPEGMDWQHSRKWDGHVMRLGLVPDHRCLLGKGITPQEAGYHRLLGNLDRGAEPPVLERRILPVRIDPKGDAVPGMTDSPILAGSDQIGLMLDHEGVCGVALMEIDPWRTAISDAARTTCAGEPAIITWPTWLAAESQGHYGPAPHLI